MMIAAVQFPDVPAVPMTDEVANWLWRVDAAVPAVGNIDLAELVVSAPSALLADWLGKWAEARSAFLTNLRELADEPN